MPQSLSQLYVHLIFSTKHREPMLLSPVREDLHAYLAAVLNNQDSPALKVGGMSDHVHALFRLSKNLALAKIVEEMKTSSSNVLPRHNPDKISRCSMSFIHCRNQALPASLAGCAVLAISYVCSQRLRNCSRSSSPAAATAEAANSCSTVKATPGLPTTLRSAQKMWMLMDRRSHKVRPQR